MIGLYNRTPNNGNQANVVNGYGMQPGLWSSSAFTSGYGYNKPAAAASMDQKSAIAFNSAQAQGHISQGLTHAQAQAQAQAKDQAYGSYGNDYRYQNQAQMYSPTAYQSQIPSPHHQHQSLHQSPQYGHSPYVSSARNVTSPRQQHSYAYAYGAPGSHLNNNAAATGATAGGRVREVSGAHDGQYSGYYGGINQTVPAAGYAAGGHGAIGQAGRAGGFSAQGSRKMW